MINQLSPPNNTLNVLIVRFWGWSENAREQERDLQEMRQLIKEGKSIYGESHQPEWVQASASRNSQWSQLKFGMFILYSIRHNFDTIADLIRFIGAFPMYIPVFLSQIRAILTFTFQVQLGESSASRRWYGKIQGRGKLIDRFNCHIAATDNRFPFKSAPLLPKSDEFFVHEFPINHTYFFFLLNEHISGYVFASTY